MKKLSIGLGSLLLMIMMAAALAYAVPAAWVTHQLASAAKGRVQIAHARGLWHRGNGILVLSSGSGGNDAVHWAQSVHWNVAPLQWPALWALQITLPQVGPPMTVTFRVGLTSWSAQSAPWQGLVPLNVLSGLGAPFNTLALEGKVKIGLSALQFSSIANNKAAVTKPNVQIYISGLRSALAQGVILGDYVISGQASATGGTFALRTATGALLMEGNGLCMVKARLSCSFNGTARAARHDDALLGNLLGLLGKQHDQNASKHPITELRW